MVEYLAVLSKKSKEQEHVDFFTKLVPMMSAPELRVFIRLIRKDLRFDAGSKIILDAISPTAYATYQSTNDLEGIVKGEDIGEVCVFLF